MANYDVRHVPEVPGIPFYGVTDMDKHVIFIVDNQDFVSKTKTAIHEVAHVVQRMHNLPDKDEEVINSIEESEYSRLFVK